MPESNAVMIPESLPPFGTVHLAAAGFLARYSGRTRDAYALDLKTYFEWCAVRRVEVFAMTRPQIEGLRPVDGGGTALRPGDHG